ncbi:MAG TPA: substrate-binding domain-containing protein [Xanthobacteraceae bacterium]|nr:substrate-binding domain-containing protein [Xanthobacteraceae bacterium]
MASSSSAAPATLRVIAGGGISNVLQAFIPRFEEASGERLAVTYGGTPALQAALKSGAPFDCAVVPYQVFSDAAARARLAEAPTTDIARVGVGLGVPEGAAPPDIGTPEALKRTLLLAKSVAMVPQSANGAHILKVFERLGVAEAMKPKIRAYDDPLALAPALARGEAEIGLYVTNLLLAPGITLVGELPAALNTTLTFTAGLAREPENAAGARAFLAALASPEAAALIRAKGMEPLF